MRARAALVSAALLFGAACGGSSGAVTAADTPGQLAADVTVAQRALLRPGDVPNGYKPRPHRAVAPALSDAEERELRDCTKLPPVFLDAGSSDPRAASPDFIYGRFAGRPAQVVASDVALARSSADLRVALARVTDDAAARCFEPYFRAGFEQGLADRPTVTMGDFAVQPLDIGRIGDQAAAFHATATVDTAGGPVRQGLNLYFVRTGRALVTMYAVGNNEPFDEHLAESLLSTIVSRLGSAS